MEPIGLMSADLKVNVALLVGAYTPEEQSYFVK